MRPGALDVLAKFFRLTKILIKDDFPTFERPENAISGGPALGRRPISGTPRRNIHADFVNIV